MKHCATCRCRPSAAAADTHTFQVVTEQGDLVLGTDDWAEAEQVRIDAQQKNRRLLSIRGVHPSHDWQTNAPGHFYGRKCSRCGAPDNGCFASHMPCGYDSGGTAFVTTLANEWARRKATSEADAARDATNAI